MKKIVLIVGVITILFLSSCGKGKDKYENGASVAKRMNGIILEAIENDEPEKIKGILCERLLKEHDNIDQEIEEFIHFIDGDIISVERQYGDLAGRSTQYPYGLTFEMYTGHIIDIKTNTGNRYRLYSYGYNVNIHSPDKIGIVSLTIIDWDKYKETGDTDGISYAIYLDDWN